MKTSTLLQIQGLFAAYRSRKQLALQQAISTSPHAQLLQALDLRFQCMRAVAAAKFLINKPIEDKEQVARVINSVKELAQKNGITNLDAIDDLFRHNISLAENIQFPYYDLIWQRSRDMQKLVNSAYDQLRQLIRSYHLSISYIQEENDFTSAEVLALAREVIQHASKTIIQSLANPVSIELSQEEFAEVMEKMLANYMTPSALSRSIESIQSLTANIKTLVSPGL